MNGSKMRPNMRRWIASLLIVCPLAAQQRPDPAQELESKLASPFLRHAEWTTDYDVARRQAKQRGALIFGYFTTAGY